MAKKECQTEESVTMVLIKYFVRGKPEYANYHIAVPRSSDPVETEKLTRLVGVISAYIFYPDSLTFFKSEEEARKYGKKHGFEIEKVIEQPLDPLPKELPKKELPAVPIFKTYAGASKWLKGASRRYGRDSEEYSILYEKAKPQLEPLKKIEKEEHVKKKMAEFKDSGLKIGDEVSYFSVSFTGLGGLTFKGTIILRGGIPTVKLDQRSATMSSRKIIEWDNSWEKVKQ